MRKDDLVLTLMQDNAHRQLLVIATHSEPDWAKHHLALDTLEGAALDGLFTQEVMNTLNEIILYEDEKEDFADAMGRRKQAQLLGKHGEVLNSQIRVAADIPKSEHACFRVVIERPDEITARSDALLTRIRGLAKGDDLTGLETRSTFMECADICQFYVDKGRFSAAIAYVNEGDGENVDQLQALSTQLQQTFRTSDVLCHYEAGLFCILMPETSLEHAKIPLTRFRATLDDDTAESMIIALAPVERNGDVAQFAEKFSKKIADGAALDKQAILL